MNGVTKVSGNEKKLS